MVMSRRRPSRTVSTSPRWTRLCAIDLEMPTMSGKTVQSDEATVSRVDAVVFTGRARGLCCHFVNLPKEMTGGRGG